MNFAGEPVSLTLGGMDPDVPEEWRNRQFAMLTGPEIFPYGMTSSQVHQLLDNPSELCHKAIFSTDDITDVGHRHIEMVAGKDGRELVINLNHTLSAPVPVIHWLKFQINSFVTIFDAFENIPSSFACLMFGYLGQLFRRDVQNQIEFTSLGTLLTNLQKRPHCLKAEFYFAICSVLSEITVFSLHWDWFRSLVLNLWLWSKSDFTELVVVLQHWSHVLPVRYAQELQEAPGSCFSSFLHQYLIFF
jgi:hypothetical protein